MKQHCTVHEIASPSPCDSIAQFMELHRPVHETASPPPWNTAPIRGTSPSPLKAMRHYIRSARPSPCKYFT
eukprot:1427580-Rhodomonas_salina.1